VSEDDPQEIDVLAGIKGSPSGITDRAAIVEFEGLKLRIATPEDLIILKLLAGSLQDIEDARGILRSQQGSLSRQLLQELCPHHLQEMLDALLDEVSQGQC
jgi:predicted nucleotidyltransferase